MTHKIFDLSGKVAIVSGAAQGMGKEMSIGFAEAGSDVILVDINNIGAEDTANDISKLGVNCNVFVTSYKSIMYMKISVSHPKF